ncbi:hypothetical protein GCM10007159_32650 [Modicisalibacter luteus]|nr:hypothetical protein GCM10007159_32650 [Halomonas lutea]
MRIAQFSETVRLSRQPSFDRFQVAVITRGSAKPLSNGLREVAPLIPIKFPPQPRAGPDGSLFET